MFLQLGHECVEAHVQGESYQLSGLEGWLSLTREQHRQVGDTNVGTESYETEVDELVTEEYGLRGRLPLDTLVGRPMMLTWHTGRLTGSETIVNKKEWAGPRRKSSPYPIARRGV